MQLRAALAVSLLAVAPSFAGLERLNGTITDPSAATMAVLGSLDDVTGDGIGDFAVRTIDAGSGSPRVQIMTGSEPLSVATLFSPTGEASFGQFATTLGDLDGDSIPEFAVSETLADPSGIADAGQALIYRGSDRTVFRTVRGTALVAGGRQGVLHRLGDIDADGVADYALSPALQPRTDWTQYVEFFSGATGTSIARPVLPTTTDTNSQVSIIGLADRTGDGKREVLVGLSGQIQPARDALGELFLLNGATGATIVRYPTPAPDGTRFGFAIREHPDYDADGITEIVSLANGGTTNPRGYLFQIRGSDGGLMSNQLLPVGIQWGSTRFETVSDLNRNGTADFFLASNAGFDENGLVDHQLQFFDGLELEKIGTLALGPAQLSPAAWRGSTGGASIGFITGNNPPNSIYFNRGFGVPRINESGALRFPVLEPGGSATILMSFVSAPSGLSDVTIRSVQFDGADAGDFRLGANADLTWLRPGETRHLPVEFRPAAAGAKSARIVIATDHGNLALDLMGSAFAPSAGSADEVFVAAPEDFGTATFNSTLARIARDSGDRAYVSRLAELGGFGTGPDIRHVSALLVEDDETLIVAGTGSSGTAMFRINKFTGARTILSGNGRGSGPDIFPVEDLEFVDGGALLAASANGAYFVDIITGDRRDFSTDIRGAGFPAENMRFIERDRATGETLAYCDRTPTGDPARLLRIDPATGDRTLLLDLDEANVPTLLAGMEWVATGSILFAPLGGELFLYDTTGQTGFTDLIDPAGPASYGGIVASPEGPVFGIERNSGTLVRINIANGRRTPIAAGNGPALNFGDLASAYPLATDPNPPPKFVTGWLLR